jgi:hypothetical protein
MLNDTPIWALGGESLTAPENTIPAYWAALGSNADGLAIDVRLTGDGIPVCTFTDSLNDTAMTPGRFPKSLRKSCADLMREVSFGLQS